MLNRWVFNARRKAGCESMSVMFQTSGPLTENVRQPNCVLVRRTTADLVVNDHSWRWCALRLNATEVIVAVALAYSLWCSLSVHSNGCPCSSLCGFNIETASRASKKTKPSTPSQKGAFASIFRKANHREMSKRSPGRQKVTAKVSVKTGSFAYVVPGLLLVVPLACCEARLK